MMTNCQASAFIYFTFSAQTLVDFLNSQRRPKTSTDLKCVTTIEPLSIHVSNSGKNAVFQQHHMCLFWTFRDSIMNMETPKSSATLIQQ